MKKLLYFIFKYLGLIKTNFKISNDVDFGCDSTNDFFTKSLKKSNLYLEFRSGSSTLLADRLFKQFISIESDKNFYNFIINKISTKDRLFLVDFGLISDYSMPLFYSIRKYFFKKIANQYSGMVFKQLEQKNKVPDLVLIDGRFRVLCALKLFCYLKNKTEFPTIIFDDYRDREYYKIIENFFTIKILGRFAILEKMKNNDAIDEYIEKYSCDPR